VCAFGRGMAEDSALDRCTRHSTAGGPLDLETATAGADAENAELHEITMRFWIGAVLAFPVFVLAMAHLIPALGRQPRVDGDASRWMEFALATPAVWWAAGRHREVPRNVPDFNSFLASATLPNRTTDANNSANLSRHPRRLDADWVVK